MCAHITEGKGWGTGLGKKYLGEEKIALLIYYNHLIVTAAIFFKIISIINTCMCNTNT